MHTHKLLQHPAALCNRVRRIAMAAGEVTFDYFDDAGFFAVEDKADGSPVTVADRMAEELIVKELADLVPGIPCVAEELAAAGIIPDLGDQEYFWLVDAIDGTREFIKGSPDYTVNIALVNYDTPILGVIYAPARGELYAAYGPETAVRWSEDTKRDKPLSVRPMPPGGLVVVTGERHRSSPAFQAYMEAFKVEKIITRGSSLKICALAAGKADLYPRFGPTNEWDTAAGDAILRSAGGCICDMDGQPLTYGHSERRFENPDFIAAGIDFFEALADDEQD